MTLASCFFGTCEACASRRIVENEFTVYCCQGGLDIETFEQHLPCDTCVQRMQPATQDLDDFELNSILFGYGAEDVIHDTESDQLFQDIMKEYEDRWPRISLPLEKQRKEMEDGRFRQVRVYKPFKRTVVHDTSSTYNRIAPHEQHDFNDFLKMIF